MRSLAQHPLGRLSGLLHVLLVFVGSAAVGGTSGAGRHSLDGTQARSPSSSPAPTRRASGSESGSPRSATSSSSSLRLLSPAAIDVGFTGIPTFAGYLWIAVTSVMLARRP